MTVAFILLACIGLTFILKYGSVLRWPRSILVKNKYFRELFNCSLCLGFWSGVLIATYLLYINWDPYLLLLPLASAAVSWVGDGLIGFIQAGELLMDKKAEKE